MRTETTERGQARTRIGEGLRRLTPGLIQAEHKAAELVGAPLPPRHELRHAVTVLRSAELLTATEAETLVTLIGFCGTWEREGVPIVFATNQRLRSRLSGVNNDRAMCARLAGLGRRGFICHVERPGGRRGVEIDPETGEKVYFGISLLPLVGLLPEATRIEAQREAEYAARMKQKRRSRSMLTRIEALVSAALDLGLNADEWIARFDMATSLIDLVEPCDDLDDLSSYADELEDLRTICAQLIDDALLAGDRLERDLSTGLVEKVDQNRVLGSGCPEPEIHPKTVNKTITDKSEHCTARSKGHDAKHRTQSHKPALTRAGVGLEEKPGGAVSSVNRDHLRQEEMFQSQDLAPALITSQPAGSDMSSIELVQREIDKYRITPEHLADVSEGLAAYLPYGTEDDPEWKDLAAAAFALRPVIGLSERGWRRAVSVLGVNGATVAMAVATADVNRSRIRKSAAEYIVWMAKFTQDGGHVGIGAKLRAALTRSNGKANG